MTKKKKRQHEDFVEDDDMLDGQEPDGDAEDIHKGDNEDMGEGGQEPQNDQSQADDTTTEDDGRVDLDALPENARKLVETLLAQVRQKNREARNLRKRLKKLEKSDAGNAGNSQAGSQPEGESDDAKALREALERAEREREALRKQLRDAELSKAIEKLAAKDFREEALEEVEALVRLKLGDDAFDGDKVDKDEIADFLEELKERKPHLLKPKKNRKPPIGGGQRKKKASGGDDAEAEDLAIRFGI